MKLRGYVALLVVCIGLILTDLVQRFVIMPWVLLVLVVFAAQVALSHWWLARYRYGPVEWLWRAATYLQLPAMRRG